MSPIDPTSIINTTIAALPDIFAIIRGRAHGGMTLTDAQVAAALKQALASSVAVDDAWLAAHPPGSDVGSDVPGGGAG